MGIPAALADALRMQLRILSFRFDRSDLEGFAGRHLLLGMMCTWLAGVGRYWDHPDPYMLQALGLGSLLIVALLSLLLWLTMLPLRPQGWSLVHVATFVSLTALPAILYALPVERWLPLREARQVNMLFLAAVAAWRVALLASYLRRQAGFHPFVVAVGLLLPLTGVVTALAALNLEKAVFDVMRGLHESQGTANDSAYMVVVVLTLFSLWTAPLLGTLYLAAVASRRGWIRRLRT